MKIHFLVAFIGFSLSLAAQKALSYNEVLKLTKEVKIIDRLYLDISNFEKKELDLKTAQQLFKKVYGNSNDLPKNTKYYLSGKITKHPDFNLLFLYSEEDAIDSTRNFDLILLTTRKDGTQVAILNAASDVYYTRNNKSQFHKTRSYLYNGFVIKQENEISVFNKKFEAEYRVNDYGMIVFYPKWAKS